MSLELLIHAADYLERQYGNSKYLTFKFQKQPYKLKTFRCKSIKKARLIRTQQYKKQLRHILPKSENVMQNVNAESKQIQFILCGIYWKMPDKTLVWMPNSVEEYTKMVEYMCSK